MRILLDECLPRRLRGLLPDQQVSTVPEMGWSGMKNGVLLQHAEAAFDVFVTADQNLRYQQSLRGQGIAIIVLVAPDNRYETLARLMPRVAETLECIQPGQVVQVEAGTD